MVTAKKTKSNDAPKAARPAKVAKASAPATTDPRNALQKRGTVVGIVVSDKMQKTIVVKVDRRIRHTDYHKFIVRSRKFKAHDEKNEAKVGDRVELVESRPLSREKRWALKSIIRRAGQVIEANV